MSELTFNWTLEASEHEEAAGEYERMLDRFDNLHHTRPRLIRAGTKAYEMLKPWVHSDIVLARGKGMHRRDVVMVAEVA
jgi:hypothetical protein